MAPVSDVRLQVRLNVPASQSLSSGARLRACQPAVWAARRQQGTLWPLNPVLAAVLSKSPCQCPGFPPSKPESVPSL
eukprot:2249450-Rhodomonas_salina.4